MPENSCTLKKICYLHGYPFHFPPTKDVDESVKTELNFYTWLDQMFAVSIYLDKNLSMSNSRLKDLPKVG